MIGLNGFGQHCLWTCVRLITSWLVSLLEYLSVMCDKAPRVMYWSALISWHSQLNSPKWTSFGKQYRALFQQLGHQPAQFGPWLSTWSSDPTAVRTAHCLSGTLETTSRMMHYLAHWNTWPPQLAWTPLISAAIVLRLALLQQRLLRVSQTGLFKLSAGGEVQHTEGTSTHPLPPWCRQPWQLQGPHAPLLLAITKVCICVVGTGYFLCTNLGVIWGVVDP